MAWRCVKSSNEKWLWFKKRSDRFLKGIGGWGGGWVLEVEDECLV